MSKKNQSPKQMSLCYHLRDIEPKTESQESVFDQFYSGKNLVLHGSAGTGKTFLGLYLALDSVINQNTYHKVTVIRSSVASRDLGFLPGDADEKMAIYEAPYKGIVKELLQRGDAYEVLKKKDILEFMSTSYVRGITLNRRAIVVDEIQNMNWMELSSIITRAGENSRFIFCGDYAQSDLPKQADRVGLKNFIQVIREMDQFSFVEFGHKDIVRSKLVKDFIIKTDELGLSA